MSTPEALQQLGVELLAQPLKNANHATMLLAAIQAEEVDQSLAAIRALQLFFHDSFERGELTFKSKQDQVGSRAPGGMHQEWLGRQYAAFQRRLRGLFASGSNQAVQIGALSATLELARAEKPGEFSAVNFTAFLQTALSSKHAVPEVTEVLVSKFMGYADVRYHTLRTISKTAERAAELAASTKRGAHAAEEAAHLLPNAQATPQEVGRNLHALLARVRPLSATAAAQVANVPGGESSEMPAEGLGSNPNPTGLEHSWCGAAEAGRVAESTAGEGAQRRRKRRRLATEQGEGENGRTAAGGKLKAAKWASAVLQKRAFSQAWLALLRLPLPDDVYKKVLTRMHEDVIPHMADPLLLADRLTRALDSGGMLGMLALHAIFVLVTKHGLEYPDFYTRLYQLLQPAAFLAKQRARFFQLADVFLASSLVPAYTVAAFIKRFARLALTAPPAGALVCLAFVHNLLRRHPACNVLVNRPKLPSAAVNGTATVQDDVFLEKEADPAKTRAIESSLWEVDTLRNHFCPQAAVVAGQMLEKDLSDRKKTAEMDIAPLVGGSYTSLIKGELTRRIKQIPTAFYQTPPTRLFDANSTPDFVGWAF